MSDFEKETYRAKVLHVMTQLSIGSTLWRKVFVEEMLKEHRTHQQDFTNLCFEFIGAMAKVQQFDGRNELAVKCCRQIVAQNPNIG